MPDQSDWFSEDASTFGDRLAHAREAAALSQSELARRLGVRAKTIRAWENDQQEPRANRVQMLAGILNVSLMWLLTGAGAGLDAPADQAHLSTQDHAILDELRGIQTELNRLADRSARLEAQLRKILKEAQ